MPKSIKPQTPEPDEKYATDEQIKTKAREILSEARESIADACAPRGERNAQELLEKYLAIGSAMEILKREHLWRYLLWLANALEETDRNMRRVRKLGAAWRKAEEEFTSVFEEYFRMLETVLPV